MNSNRNILAASLLLLFSSCSVGSRTSNIEHTALTTIATSAIGAGAGSIVGNQLNLAGEGAAVGAGAGLLSGFFLGSQLDNLSYRIERSEQLLKQIREDLNTVRSSLKERLYEGDHQIFEIDIPKLQLRLEGFKLENHHRDLLRLYADYFKLLNFPALLKVQIQAERDKDVSGTGDNLGFLKQSILEIFKEEGLGESLIQIQSMVQPERDGTDITLDIQKKFNYSVN